MFKSPTLYAISVSSKLMKFESYVEHASTDIGGITTVITKTGYVDGKMKEERSKIKEGKNIGKSNETSVFEQAKLECISKYNKKMQEGYKDVLWMRSKLDSGVSGGVTDDEAVRIYFGKIWYNTDDNDRLKPMLAQKFKGHSHKIQYPAFVQRKYNGVRCIAWFDDLTGKFRLRSREGREYFMPHITDELLRLAKANHSLLVYDLDGELYEHGAALQEITSYTKKYTLLSSNVTYVIYDILSITSSQQDRVDWLMTIPESKIVIPVATHFVHNYDQVISYFELFRNEGYEGAMVRTRDCQYLPGFRSSQLLKVKSEESAEFTIVSVTTKDELKPEDFVWICENASGKRFEVKPHGTEGERRHYYENYQKYLGKKLQLSFHDWTKDKIPFHITSVTIRDYE